MRKAFGSFRWNLPPILNPAPSFSNLEVCARQDFASRVAEKAVEPELFIFGCQIAVFSSYSCSTPNLRARISARRNFPDYDPRSNQSKLNTTDENQTKRHKPEFRRSYLTSRRFCRWNRTCKGNSYYYSTTNQSHFPKTDSCHSGISRLFADPVRSPSQCSKGHCHFLGKWNPQTQRGCPPFASSSKKPPRSAANRLSPLTRCVSRISKNPTQASAREGGGLGGGLRGLAGRGLRSRCCGASSGGSR